MRSVLAYIEKSRLARSFGTAVASKTKSPPEIAKSGRSAAIFPKHLAHPSAAINSGCRWVSVKKTKSKEPGGPPGDGPKDAARAIGATMQPRAPRPAAIRN